MMFGVGATIGTGIFFVLAETVPKAGPAVLLSFIFVGLVAGMTALCYAEVAATIPVSGSAYSYAMASLGELPAYIVGWCLILEYGVAGAATSVGWAEYFNELLEDVFHFHLPHALSNGLLAEDRGPDQPAGRRPGRPCAARCWCAGPRSRPGPTRSWSASSSACC